MSVTIKHITAKDNPLLMRIRKIARSSTGYRDEGAVWLEGDHLCEAYRAKVGLPLYAVCAQTAFDKVWRDSPLTTQGSVVVIPDALFDGLTQLEAHTGLGYLIALPSSTEVVLPQGRDVVVLDRLQDAGNVGTILRTCAAFGVMQVIALKGTAALWSAKVLRAAMGAHFGLLLREACSFDDVKQLSLPLVVTSSHDAQPLPQVTLPSPCAWVFGHEGQGVSQALMDLSEIRVGIPQPGGQESLNVATAASICLYESASRQWRTALS